MDDALRPANVVANQFNIFFVLILILMDDALRLT